MKFSYRLARLCGSVHDGANVVFASLPASSGSEGENEELLFSAVGNRVSVFELTRHCSYTLPVECRSDVHRLAVNREGTLLLAIDREGRAVVVSISRRLGLHRFNFKGLVSCKHEQLVVILNRTNEQVRDAKFSPDDRFLAVALGSRLQIWHAPGHNRDLTPFVLHNTLAGHSSDITCIDWSPDGR
jgi:periodic tryptophan protein 2